ncbi:hypothetical protein BgiMline_002298 [Biomphalaria glabrata]|uniref:Uncharacterized protein LOC106078379 n=1 Tax=Biomphalaria glabrata TaxID=6526 RepID=A0A9W3ATQ0_BIOGL|nr:uncharacterized protein LOC106078379 [Biomphalaria glabrata]XP_055890601.1 uncharacterized protein LOC106078379 [Biomphalaria glabrata]XP_055890609.1 uncharacterized protein LOC106078379 [Biomphalaria glabrata]XP_055890616.1 uncharacterized protein LOC106078379 [Biomphalaria glabrata]KAI8770144.1 hypothetical protein BgiMline_002167 [Biomphalaria glabrata]
MSNDGTSAAGPGARHLARESHLMRSIVRNMVSNMEGVLNDLQGIMGDIQSLVVQIDSVTEKIDKQCGTERNEQTSPHRVQKPRCLHGSPALVASTNECKGSQVAAKPSRQPGCHQQVNSLNDPSIVDHLIKGVNHVCLADNPSSCIRTKVNCNPRPKSSDVYAIFDKSDLIKKFAGSRSFQCFSRGSGGLVSSPSGGIAIVHPTIHKNKDEDCAVQEEIFEKMKAKPQSGPRPLSLGQHPVVHCLPIFAHNIPKAEQEKRQQQRYNEFQGRLEKKDKNHSGGDLKRVSRIRHAVTSVYNKSFQAVTPTEQLSPASRPKNLNNEIKQTARKSTFEEVQTHRTTITQERFGQSLPGSPKLTRSVSCLPQGSSPNSPQLQRPSVKAIYSKIDGSTPSTFGKTPGSVRVQQPSPHHYYHSIESDLDSEVANEGPGTRSMTPDIDWSYLNLVGNDRELALPSGKWRNSDKTSHVINQSDNDGYEIPVASKPHLVGQRTFQMLQTSPDVLAQLPMFQFQNSKTEVERSSEELSDDQVSFDIVLRSSLLQHIFCSELSDGEEGFYCGCYEAVVDSVLENLAGYETLEEACKDFENEAIAYESYVSFDDEFEEDDWDMGLRPEDNEDFDTNLPLFHSQNMFDYGEFAILDEINKNISGGGACQNEKKSDAPFYFYLEESVDNNIKAPPFKRTSVPQEDLYDEMELPSTSGNSFTDDDCCAIKPQVPDCHTNFILWPKSFASAPETTNEKESLSHVMTESQLTSSDDASCQAVGSGSPMSFSSPEAAFTSPDTDRFVTSSEGDDLLTSQEEGYFRTGDQIHSPRDDNAISNCQQAKIRPHGFLQSLYIFCQKREDEASRDYEKSRLKENAQDSAVQKIDNSRDNVSDTGSYTEDLGSYNRNVNTWTAYTMVHMQADDVSDCASDILNDNNVTSSMTASYIDADNIGSAAVVGSNQAVSF